MTLPPNFSLENGHNQTLRSEGLTCCCRVCPPPAGSCGSCSAKLASYYCNICHLWDDEPGRAIYHCPFCNVCRRGQGLGVDFFHCMQCNACMSLSLFNTHTCRCVVWVVGWMEEDLEAQGRVGKEAPVVHSSPTPSQTGVLLGSFSVTPPTCFVVADCC
jgi:hypothetical protein